MRYVMFLLALACIGAGDARANVVIAIDKTQQRMSVSVDGEDRYTWPISTARAGYVTPNGSYHPELLARRWFSRKYYGSPMPHSIFFHGGFAIHGSYEISHLGRAASHGCIRLHPDHAAVLFALVKQEGNANTEIVVTGSDPVARHIAGGRRNYYFPWFAHRGFYGRF
jgi:lipoprotein-anchoring transpeptidase ErfK/SrfK